MVGEGYRLCLYKDLKIIYSISIQTLDNIPLSKFSILYKEDIIGITFNIHGAKHHLVFSLPFMCFTSSFSSNYNERFMIKQVEMNVD